MIASGGAATGIPMDLERPAIDATLARRLVATQFPHWARLAVRPVVFGGWDNRTFHLGKRMLVRLPSAADYAAQVDKQQRWLPKLAAFLPLAIPAPLAVGAPGCGYPWRWSIYRWLTGETAVPQRIGDLRDFATRLAQFLAALQGIDPAGGPSPGAHNFYRGGPLTTYDAQTRQAIAALERKIDVETVTAVWDAALATTWQGPPVWIHGDVSTGNLLLQRGRLSAVIDFGNLGVGDPACDLSIAWTLFDSETRDVFRALLALDAGTWERGRGWTLWKALIVAAGLTTTNGAETAQPWRIIDEVLLDHKDRA